MRDEEQTVTHGMDDGESIAIQISVTIDAGADVFLINDKKLKQIKEIKVFFR